MNNWKEYKLSDLMQIKYGKDHKHLADGPFPLYGSGGIMRYVEKPLYSEASILIPRKGTLSNLFFLDKPFWSVDTMFYSIINKQLALPKYLYYTLKTFDLASLNVGSAVPSLTTEVLNDVLVSVPDIDTQTAIAEILSSLDAKIELNNKINQELENLAQTLFKQWFIDFEFPNENGEPYKSSGGVMVDSVLGEIPKGWSVDSIYKVSDVIYGAPFKSSLFNQENKGFPLIRIRDLKTFKPQNWTEEVHPKGTKIFAGDLVVGMDAEFRPHFWLGKPAWLNQRVCHFRPKRSYSKLFVREIIRPQLAFFENSSVGTTVIHLGKADIDTFKSIIPTNEVLIHFEEISNSIFDAIINYSKETQELTSLRDTILPKLISGELEVSEALTQTTA
jgi:type I restriction enzyme S subunit